MGRNGDKIMKNDFQDKEFLKRLTERNMDGRITAGNTTDGSKFTVFVPLAERQLNDKGAVRFGNV